MARGLERRDTSSERNRTNGIFKGRGRRRRRIPGAIAPDRLNGKDLPPHHPDVCGLRTRIPDRTALRAIMARRTVLPGILVLKPQASGWCGGRPFPFSRSGAIAPGILRRPRPLKIPFIRFLSDDVSLLSKPRAIMARSALCPVHFLFFVLRAGGHNGVQLGILREAVNKRDGGVSEEQQPFAGIGMGHIGKLVGADPKLFG